MATLSASSSSVRCGKLSKHSGIEDGLIRLADCGNRKDSEAYCTVILAPQSNCHALAITSLSHTVELKVTTNIARSLPTLEI